jgi:hypothetical protein
MRKLLLCLLAGLILGSIAVPANATPGPELANTYVTVCNQSGSDDDIRVYSTAGLFGSREINQGTCWDLIDNGNSVRVDVDPSGGEADIDSWRKADSSWNWGPCYQNEDGSSDPYSSSPSRYPPRTAYYTSAGSNC